ncbi:Aldehyde/histidinol dehydrogenase [Xylogone sp. PMI_703]|nr:Aldehyde/histidinol dehydrogenase [Xylogone sp. PMI_703]
MATSKIAPFEATTVESIPGIVQEAQAAFRSQKTKPIEYRLHQLRKLYWGIKDNQDSLLNALKSDLNKSEYESFLSEIIWCLNDIVFMTKNLRRFMKDEPGEDIPLMNTVLSPKIRKEPLGTVLVIGAYNFPLQLSISPFTGAIAAGCTAVLKPSEVSPATAMVIKKIVEESLDTTAYKVVNGAIPETTALLNEKWDKICYTGNASVGKIIAKKAAETLTPVLLELGGLNPAIVTKNANPYLAARRLLWAKFHNAGQVCISQNYTMVDKEILPAFLEQLKVAMDVFFPNGAKASPDYSRIVNHRHFLRIKKMLDETNGKIIIGGEMDESENFIAPTVVIVDDVNDSLIKEESFGPLMPILPVNNIDEAIRIANEVDRTPLGMYPFGTKEETNRLLNEITSGGASVNDGFFHGSIGTFPFGGVGGSGQGSYRGKASFDAFTHRRSITTTPGWIEKLLEIRYPPYTGKLSQYKRTSELKPDFDREGNKVKGLGYWAGFIFSLGGKSIKDAVARWIILALIAGGGRKYAERQGRLPSYLK